jgi:hypothetical protein
LGNDDDKGYLIIFFVIAALIAANYWAGGIQKAWYSVRYMVLPDHVRMDAEPKDCDFMHAPLGDKGCHYEAAVAAYNAEGDWVGGDDAPKFGHDTKTGKTIVSYDAGKTWAWFSADIPNPKIDVVLVTWVKKTD